MVYDRAFFVDSGKNARDRPRLQMLIDEFCNTLKSGRRVVGWAWHPLAVFGAREASAALLSWRSPPS